MDVASCSEKLRWSNDVFLAKLYLERREKGLRLSRQRNIGFLAKVHSLQIKSVWTLSMIQNFFIIKIKQRIFSFGDREDIGFIVEAKELMRRIHSISGCKKLEDF